MENYNKKQTFETVMEYTECGQCGFESARREISYPTGEWSIVCRRCGYSELHKWITGDNDMRIGWRHDVLDGYGQEWAETPGGSVVGCTLSSVEEVENAAKRMRDSIASGELDGGRSYVTRWDPERKRVEVVAGTWLENEE